MFIYKVLHEKNCFSGLNKRLREYSILRDAITEDDDDIVLNGCSSTRTFTNSCFGKLVLYFSLVNSYFMPLVNSYFLIGQLVLFDWSTRTL